MQFDKIASECEIVWTDWPANVSCCGGCNGGSNSTNEIFELDLLRNRYNETIVIDPERRLSTIRVYIGAHHRGW